VRLDPSYNGLVANDKSFTPPFKLDQLGETMRSCNNQEGSRGKQFLQNGLQTAANMASFFSELERAQTRKNVSLICDKSVTTQNLAILSYWYRKKCLQMHF